MELTEGHDKSFRAEGIDMDGPKQIDLFPLIQLVPPAKWILTVLTLNRSNEENLFSHSPFEGLFKPPAESFHLMFSQ